jgi:excisionase family DNA binding protein
MAASRLDKQTHTVYHLNKVIQMPLENYFTVIEVAKRLGIHTDTVKRLCCQGDIPAVKIRNTWLIDRDKLEIFAGTYTPRRGGRKRLF